MGEFELPTGGGSLLVAWRLKDKRILVVGGGEVASGRIKSLLVADPYITLVAPRDGLHPLTKFYINTSDRITYHDRTFSGPDDLAGVDMALTTIDDVEWSRRICAMCRERRIPVNVADIPPSCDFYFGSQIRNGPLQIMVSTNGNGPKLAGIIRSRIEECLPEKVDKAIENVGLLRARLRRRAPGVGGETGKKRMQWISAICTTWNLDELAELDESTMDTLLTEGWDRDAVPSSRHRARVVQRKPSYVSDAAFAASVGFFFGLALSIAAVGEEGICSGFLRDTSSFLRRLSSSLSTKS